jgi:high-affinity iron transporter
VLGELDTALAALQQGDADEGSEHLQLAVQAWPSIEGTVAAKSQSDYGAIEGELGKAIGALKATPADLVTAEASVASIRAMLAPYANPQSYTMFDAAAVILREGLEALLVVVALLAVLQRSGNKDKQRWVWAGVGVGVLFSIATGFVLQIVFSRITAGQNRELIEGITGLVAAGMLFYVSYWLHSKSCLADWQKYIHTQTCNALARGSMVGLTTLAFLTVFREGAETTIFYMGMAPSISTNELLLGLLLGLAVLLVVAVLMLVMGVRLPIRLFFQVAGLLVYYLGFKFLGTGVRALQVAGAASSTPVSFLPEVPFLGIHPTWETLIPQILLLVVAVGAVWYVRISAQKLPVAPTGTASAA